MLSSLQMLSTTAAASSSRIGVGKQECKNAEVNSNTMAENSLCHEHMMNCEKETYLYDARSGRGIF